MNPFFEVFINQKPKFIDYDITYNKFNKEEFDIVHNLIHTKYMHGQIELDEVQHGLEFITFVYEACTSYDEQTQPKYLNHLKWYEANLISYEKEKDGVSITKTDDCEFVLQKFISKSDNNDENIIKTNMKFDFIPNNLPLNAPSSDYIMFYNELNKYYKHWKNEIFKNDNHEEEINKFLKYCFNNNIEDQINEDVIEKIKIIFNKKFIKNWYHSSKTFKNFFNTRDDNSNIIEYNHFCITSKLLDVSNKESITLIIKEEKKEQEFKKLLDHIYLHAILNNLFNNFLDKDNSIQIEYNKIGDIINSFSDFSDNADYINLFHRLLHFIVDYSSNDKHYYLMGWFIDVMKSIGFDIVEKEHIFYETQQHGIHNSTLPFLGYQTQITHTEQNDVFLKHYISNLN